MEGPDPAPASRQDRDLGVDLEDATSVSWCSGSGLAAQRRPRWCATRTIGSTPSRRTPRLDRSGRSWYRSRRGARPGGRPAKPPGQTHHEPGQPDAVVVAREGDLAEQMDTGEPRRFSAARRCFHQLAVQSAAPCGASRVAGAPGRGAFALLETWQRNAELLEKAADFSSRRSGWSSAGSAPGGGRRARRLPAAETLDSGDRKGVRQLLALRRDPRRAQGGQEPEDPAVGAPSWSRPLKKNISTSSRGAL